MQRINSVYDWQDLPVGQQAVINSDVPGQRLVKLRVNSPSPAALYLAVDDIADPIFLARVEGLDEIRFNIAGSYRLFAEGSFVLFDTMDGTRADVEPVAPESFTKIAERQAVDPTLQLMQMKMQENIERRMTAMMSGFADVLGQKDAELEAARKAVKAASGTPSEPDAGSVPPDPPVAKADGATGGKPDAE